GRPPRWEQRSEVAADARFFALDPRTPGEPPRPLRPGRHPLLGGSTQLVVADAGTHLDRKSTRLNSSHLVISYAVFCLKKKNCIHHIKEIIMLMATMQFIIMKSVLRVILDSYSAA